MEVLLKINVILLTGVLLPVLGQSNPQNLAAQCSCPIKHPQEKICRADIVIQGRVIKVESPGIGKPGMGGLLEYTIKATKVFKGSDSVVTKGQRIKMITSSSSQKCGVTEMAIGELYILTGLELEGEVFFSLCEWVQRFQDLTPDQRLGLRSEYNVGCGFCLIDQRDNSVPGIHDNPSTTGNICYHDPLGSAHLMIEDCESLFSKCVPHEIGDNRCVWTESKRYNKCVAKRLKKHTALQAKSQSKLAGY
ncbi:metalloproteinase inhibitor 3-like [Acanthaster planci]|uniref:Metalloproteinase inhibitor 3-like n=1 Tax=Acanthaster planci TaxID=133434 RepID=A0A8B7Z1E3_ACAPL|nr:metalloproteinase inhibitor 3-like [Acanthaster planci]